MKTLIAIVLLAVLTLLVVVLATVRSRNSARATARLEELPDSQIAKVFVNQAGEITLNGSPASLDDLQAELRRLKGNRGVVWYSRSEPDKEPSEAIMKSFRLIVDAGLPIKLFTDEGFTRPVRLSKP